MKVIERAFFFVFYFLLLSRVIYANEPAPVMVINQLRGSESCCLPGDKTLFDRVYENDERKQLPINWAVRFDVFKDDAFVASLSALPKNQLGALLEITPELASMSGVIYKGKSDESDWYQARNS